MTSSPTLAPAAPEPLIAVACPTCFGALAVGAELFGRAADCPICGQGFLVPTKAAPETPKPATVERAAPAPAGASATPAASAAASIPSGQAAPTAPTAGAGPTRDPAPPAVAAASPAAGAETPVTRDPAADDAGRAAAPGTPTAEETAALRFREPVVTVGSGDNVVELRRLSPEEKAQRRARRNLVMLLTGVSILLAIVLTLGRSRR